MLMIAFLMNAMTALHENNLLWGGEHIVATDRTVAVS